MAVTKKHDPSPAFIETIDEIMRIYRSLPDRPSVEEVEAAKSVLKTVNTEEEMKLEEIAKQQQQQEVSKDVPKELFSILRQVRKNMVLFQSHEQRKEAAHLVEVDKLFQTFDELIQRASGVVSGDTQMEKQIDFDEPVVKSGRKIVISDESLIKEQEDGELERESLKRLLRSSSTKAAIFSTGEGDTEKLSLMKVAALIENSAKTGAVVLDLQGRLMDKIEWLPLSIGKLSDVTELNVSENRIMALPSTIGSLRALTKLDVHSNQLINLPDSIGELINLTDLDLHANKLKSLPDSFGNLTNVANLDLSSNEFTQLPQLIGNLICLKRLIAETNELEEMPYTIGSCTSLVELRLDFNQLKALPEAVGKLECLEILTCHYNRIKGLPTTIGNLSNLRELDVSFNEIEFIPENLCLVVSLKKLIIGKNFADLTALPRSIGNLKMLEELDISDNQIRVLPDSFTLLSKLRVFRADETPLEVPPREVTKLGAQAVVQYMADYISKRDNKSQLPAKKKRGLWFWVCSLFRPKRTTSTAGGMESLIA